MKKIHLLSLMILVFLSSCSSLRTAFDYDHETNFENYKTFAFHKEGMAQLQVNDIDKKRFVNDIMVNLKSKGLTMSTENPDLLVNVVIKGKDRTSVYNDYYGYGWWTPYPTMTIRQYKESSIYIDLIDRAKNQLVWQGKGTDEFNASERDKDARIQEVVSKILEQYPLGKQK